MKCCGDDKEVKERQNKRRCAEGLEVITGYSLTLVTNLYDNVKCGKHPGDSKCQDSTIEEAVWCIVALYTCGPWSLSATFHAGDNLRFPNVK